MLLIEQVNFVSLPPTTESTVLPGKWDLKDAEMLRLETRIISQGLLPRTELGESSGAFVREQPKNGADSTSPTDYSDKVPLLIRVCWEGGTNNIPSMTLV